MANRGLVQGWAGITIFVLFAGCGEGPRSAPALKPNIGLDLSHIVGFAISAPIARRIWSASAPDGATTQTLYAIDDKGNLVVTTVTTFDPNMSTTTTSSEQPLGMWNTTKYVLFAYSGVMTAGPQGVQCPGVLLRKSDGALFCYTESLEASQAIVGDDGSGDILYVVTNAGLVRIDAADTPRATVLLDAMAAGEAPTSLNVNLDADALAVVNRPMMPGLRIYKQGGGLQNITTETTMCRWTQDHDFFYAVTSTAVPGGGFQVVHLARQTDGSFTAMPLAPVGPETSGMYPCHIALLTVDHAYGYWPLVNAGTTNAIMELVGNAGAMHPVPGVDIIIDAKGFGSSIFVEGKDSAGNGTIVRVDVPAFTATTLLPAGDFTLTAMSLSAAGEVTFAATRNADNAHVIGNVAAGASTYTIVSATAPAVIDLQRIN
jgi:hypothetical protein